MAEKAHPLALPSGRTSGQRRRLRATREGKVFVFVTVGLGFAAVNTGTNLMYLVFGFMLSLIILSGILSEHTLRTLRVTRVLPSRAVAGQPLLLEVAITSAKPRLTSYSIEVSEAGEPDAPRPRCYFLKVPPQVEQRASYRRIFSHRGRTPLGPIRVATRFPFALFEKWCDVPSDDELVIFPRPRNVLLPRGLFTAEGDGRGTVRGRGVETRELRDYRSGDEARAVHWKRSASLGRPIVRELGRDAASCLSLRLDNHVPEGDTHQAARFERDVERAAYLVAVARERGEAVEICARGSTSALLAPGASDAPLLAYLALLRAEATPAPFARASAEASVVVLAELDDAAPNPEGGVRA